MDAKLFVETGFFETLGLIHIQITDNAMGMIDHHPIHTRLQIESTRMGSAAYRVHTLHGLA
jgi:hypothetical protein